MSVLLFPLCCYTHCDKSFHKSQIKTASTEDETHSCTDSENPFCLMDFFSDLSWDHLSVKAKITQHTWEELKSVESLKRACLSTSGKRAETNPVRPCGTAGLLYGTREQTGRSLRIIWQRKGWGFRTLGHSHTHSNIPRWDTPRGGGWLCEGRRCFVLEVKWWAAGRSLAHRGQRAGRSPLWRAWCARRAWTPQSP